MIELKGVVKKFDDFQVLDSIDLTIPQGTAFGLLGSNGAGKSTILRLLSGIYKQEKGGKSILTEKQCLTIRKLRKEYFL